jgi:hypothetical protein
MAWNSRLVDSRFIAIWLGSLIATFFPTITSTYGDGATDKPQIEYISPDGKFVSLSADHTTVPQSTAAFIDRETISCSLKEGETTFIVALPKGARGERLTFLNENAAACGELRIAVSNSPLPADSPKWTEVDGIVPFAHKRLFKLSMLGVETKFVRLSFHVDPQTANSARVAHPFQTPMLEATMSSDFSRLVADTRGLNLAAVSVAPLPTTTHK